MTLTGVVTSVQQGLEAQVPPPTPVASDAELPGRAAAPAVTPPPPQPPTAPAPAPYAPSVEEKVMATALFAAGIVAGLKSLVRLWRSEVTLERLIILFFVFTYLIQLRHALAAPSVTAPEVAATVTEAADIRRDQDVRRLPTRRPAALSLKAGVDGG